MKHTPGPWKAECVGVSSLGPDGVDVYEVNNGFRRIAENMTEADARLLAAAPDLKSSADECADCLGMFYDPVQAENDPTMQRIGRAIERVRAALTKATGDAQ